MRLPPRVADALIAALVLAGAATAVSVRPHGSMVSAWWPAAGLGTWLVLRQRSGRAALLATALVAVLDAVANLLVPGRPPWMCAWFGLANAVEVGLAAAVFSRAGRRPPVVTTVADAGRLLLAALVGGVVVVALVVPAVQAHYGADPLQVAASVLGSHASGQLLVLAVALTPATLPGPLLRRRVAAMVVALLLALFGVVFSVDTDASIAFVPMALLVAATFVLTPRTVGAIVLASATVVVFSSALGHGPFGGFLGDRSHLLTPGGSAALAQLYVVCLLALAVPMSLAVRERDAALVAELAASEHLAEYARLRTDLVNAVTHELRTPLTTILGFSEVLAEGLAGPISEEQEEVVRTLHRNGRRLHLLVEDLLTVAAPFTSPVAVGSAERPEPEPGVSRAGAPTPR